MSKSIYKAWRFATVQGQRWRFLNVRLFATALCRRPWWTRVAVRLSFGWHAWSLGASLVLAPATDKRQVVAAVGPVALALELYPVPFCECCGGDPDVPSDDCAAHPPAQETP